MGTTATYKSKVDNASGVCKKAGTIRDHVKSWRGKFKDSGLREELVAEKELEKAPRLEKLNYSES